MAVQIKSTIRTNATTEKVWDVFMNPDNLKFWLTDFISLTHTSGKVGEPGSTYKMKFKEGEKEIEVTEEVLKITPNKQYTFKMVHNSFESENEITLESFVEYTEFIQTIQFTPKEFFMRLIMPLLKGVMKKRTESELIKLKELIESKA